MRFKTPRPILMKTLYNLIKKFYSGHFYEFIQKLKQRIFFISNDQLSVVVVVDANDHKLELFHGIDGLMTCHNMFSGDQKSLDIYDYSMLSIEEVSSDNLNYAGLNYFLKEFPHYHRDNKTVCYIANHKGQNEMVIDEADALIMIDTLQYLLHIKRAYDCGDESFIDQEECVIVFEFDDYNYTYSCNYVALDSFDFLPNLAVKARKDRKFIEWFHEKKVIPGRIFLGQIYFHGAYETYQYSNKYAIALKPIVLYAATDSGKFVYRIYSSLATESKARLKGELLELFDEIGLYDTVFTDNYWLYSYLYKDLSELGIEIAFDAFNHFTNFVYSTLSATAVFVDDFEIIEECLKQIKDNFPMLVNDIMHNIEVDGEEEFEEDEESSNDIIC